MVRARGARRPETHRFAVGEGLLTRFLREKLAGHVEPTRQGTPRGAPVGFSRKKLAAALFAVTSADVKPTAREVGVSYGVVRKWRTEPAFKALVERLEDEFVERFCAVVDAEVGPLDDGWDWTREVGAPRRPTPSVGGRDSPGQPAGPRGADVEQIVAALYARRADWFATNLGDLRLYGPRLIRKLARHLLDEGDGAGRLGRMSVLHGLSARWRQAQPSPDLQQLGVSALLGILRFIVRALESPSLSSPQRRRALVYLGMLQRQLADPGV
jgi:hypothetical protein